MLRSHDITVYKVLESLSIFTIKHELELLPSLVAVISNLWLYVKGIQVVERPLEDTPVLRLARGIEMESRGFPVTAVTRRCHFNILIYCWEVNL